LKPKLSEIGEIFTLRCYNKGIMRKMIPCRNLRAGSEETMEAIMRKEALRNTIGSPGKVGICMAIAFICLGAGLSQKQNAAAQAPPQSAEGLAAGLYGRVSSPGGELPDWNKVRRVVCIALTRKISR
jgi:hypothetical protein